MDEKLLSQEEVDALLSGLLTASSVTQSASSAQVKPFNLSNEERIVRGRMPSLELVYERFSRLFRIGLYNVFRRNAEINVGQLNISKYSDFLRKLKSQSNLNLVRMSPFDGTTLFVMDPALVFVLVDNYFGGESKFAHRMENRDYSQTEIRVIQRILKIAFDSLTNAWEPLYPVEFEYVRSEINVQFANITNASDVVISTTFSIELADTGGEFHICMPANMLEPIRDMLRSSSQSQLNPNDNRWERFLRQEVQRAEVNLSADLTSLSSSLREIVQLNVGDILPIEMPTSLVLKAEGVPLYECQYGKLNGQYALRVENLINNNESENSYE